MIILILIIFWMITVFNFSNQDGKESSNLSREVANQIFETEEQVQKGEPYVRKMAHVTEYIVGGSLFLAMLLTFPFSEKKQMGISLLIGIGYATADEIHQLFIDGRSGQITDVLIDTAGALIGILITMLLSKILKKLFAKLIEERTG